MKLLKVIFDWLFVIGVILMIGRLLTFLFAWLDVPFITFFIDYRDISFVILIVGLIGQYAMKRVAK